MNKKLHSGPHPDADQLSIFVEGAEAPRERERMLAHLAECQECRDVVFLMRRPVETASVAAEVSKGWVWQRWLLPAGLAGAALAGLALLLIYLRPSATVPENVRQSAEVQQPEIAAPGTPLAQSGNSAPVAQAENDKNPLSRVATSTAKQKSEGAVALKAPDVGSHPASAGVANPETETRLSSGSTAAIAGAAAAPKPDAQSGSDLNSAVAQELPQTGRNITNLQPPPGQPRAQAATPQDSLETQQNLPALRVERSSGQDETLSGVSGRVTDITGAVIPKATVALRDASGSTRQIATGPDGSFRLIGMPAGHYDLTVTAQGFETNQQPIDLKPSELAMLQPVLNVGSVTQAVTVTASAPVVETSTSVASVASKLPSRLPVSSSVSVGKQVLSLDDVGTLFFSRNAGKSWKKVHPQWSGKAVRVDLTPTEAAAAKTTTETSRPQSAPSVFQLTTDSGAQWTSKDGTHWRQK